MLARLRSALRSIARRGRPRAAAEAACALPCRHSCQEPCALLALPVGARARVLNLDCPLADACRLRVLGVFEGAQVRVVDRRHGVLLDVRGSRLALDAAVARRILTAPLAA